MRTYLLGIAILLSAAAFGQRECASTEYLAVQKAMFPGLEQKFEQVENFIQHQKAQQKTFDNIANGIQLIKIPVVVHILYNNASQNISEERIASQIDALNRDFRRKNPDTASTPVRFLPFAADIQIEFYLAKSDPDGRATNGIIRKQTPVTAFRTDDKIKYDHTGGSNAWDTRSYLNIWVGPTQSIIGYSSMPGSTQETDGVVVATAAFGIHNSGPYNMGRTAVHEVGHWLGLKHIWGDSYCGDDLVDDTPSQGNFTPGCPTSFRTSCNNGNLGDMYMNYMDYTSDACVNLFTEGQKQRMRSLLAPGGPRHSLTTSKGLQEPWNTSLPEPQPEPVTDVRIFPNPVLSDLFLNLGEEWNGKEVRITDMNGKMVARILVNGTRQKINTSSYRPGVYFISGSLNGHLVREKFIKL